MNSDNKTLWIVLAIAVLFVMKGSKDSGDQSPSGAEAVATKALRQFANVMADAADDAANLEPNAGAKSLAGKVVPGFDSALLPVNELIDQAVENGTYQSTMRKVSRGYRKAVK